MGACIKGSVYVQLPWNTQFKTKIQPQPMCMICRMVQTWLIVALVLLICLSGGASMKLLRLVTFPKFANNTLEKP
jgi:hypothetical protein